jgi:predicted GIY-YIG superfamily endonuclease
MRVLTTGRLVPMATENHTTHYVYRIVCFANGKCYVGQTIDPTRRKKDHFRDLKGGYHHSPRLQNAYNKYGRKAFFFEVLEENIRTEDKSDREKFWIDFYSSHKDGFNMTLGGDDASHVGIEFTWNGVTYPSIKAAAKGVGVTTSVMQNRKSAGYTCDSDLLRVRRPVEWNGITYANFSEAAAALGVTPTCVRVRFLKGYTKDADVGREIPVTWNGVEYESMRKAAIANNLAPVAMQTRIHKGWTCDADVPTKSKPVTWNGVKYSSIREAAQAINIPYATMIVRAARGWTSDADVKHKSRNEWSLTARRPRKQ